MAELPKSQRIEQDAVTADARQNYESYHQKSSNLSNHLDAVATTTSNGKVVREETVESTLTEKQRVVHETDD